MRHQAMGRRRGSRRALGLLAAAGLAAVGLAGTAQAADGEPLPVAITGKGRVDLSLQSGNGRPTEPQVHLHLKAPGEDSDDGVPTEVFSGAYKIRIDASKLAGVADVKLPCDVDGLVATCTGDQLFAGEAANSLGGIRLDVGDDSEVGDFGSITVTGEGDGLAFTPLTIDVLVGGPEFANRKLSLSQDFKAGDTYEANLGLRNRGSMPSEGAVLRFHGSRGLSFPDSYGNCAYTETTTGSLLHQGSEALCTFPDTIGPGEAYALSEPLKVKTAGFALNDIFNYGFTAVSPSEAKALRSAKSYRQGTGPDLTLTKVSGADPADYTHFAEVDLPRTNTYDLQLTGASVSGRAGETVQAVVGFRNNGPAWISALRSGGEPLGFSVHVPEGATVTQAPDACWKSTLNDGRKGYRCWVDTPLLEDARIDFPFELRIDRVVPDAKAQVALPDWDNPRESDPSNDSAWIVLNATGGSTAGGGSTTGGSTTGGSTTDGGTQSGGSSSAGSSSGSSGGSASGTDGGAGTSGTTAGGTSGGDAGADAHGGLASTGAGGVALIAGSALLALGLGTGLFLFLRRREARTGHTA
ncbi:hypothetical protein ACL02U_05830 [Streptomyces sp. MS06]|uniref:hypothetical protein n=1 Tax=Streptomyces sp. MS06 TaxID=3385974 RepID=UPI0039A3A1FD